jgi:hypothetical protein
VQHPRHFEIAAIDSSAGNLLPRRNLGRRATDGRNCIARFADLVGGHSISRIGLLRGIIGRRAAMFHSATEPRPFSANAQL